MDGSTYFVRQVGPGLFRMSPSSDGGSAGSRFRVPPSGDGGSAGSRFRVGSEGEGVRGEGVGPVPSPLGDQAVPSDAKRFAESCAAAFVGVLCAFGVVALLAIPVATLFDVILPLIVLGGLYALCSGAKGHSASPSK